MFFFLGRSVFILFFLAFAGNGVFFLTPHLNFGVSEAWNLTIGGKPHHFLIFPFGVSHSEKLTVFPELLLLFFVESLFLCIFSQQDLIF